MGAVVQIEMEVINHLYHSNPKRLLRFIGLKSLANFRPRYVQISKSERTLAPPMHLFGTLRGIARRLNIPHITLRDDLKFFEKMGILTLGVQTRTLLIIFNGYVDFSAQRPNKHRTNSEQTPNNQYPLPELFSGEKTHRVQTNSVQSPNTYTIPGKVRLGLEDSTQKEFKRLPRSEIEKKAPFFAEEFKRHDALTVKADLALLNNLRFDGYELEDLEIIAEFLRKYGIPTASGIPTPLKNSRPIEFMTCNIRWLIQAIASHHRKENKVNEKVAKIKKLAKEATEKFFEKYPDVEIRQEEHDRLMRGYNQMELKTMPEDVRAYAPIVQWYEVHRRANS